MNRNLKAWLAAIAIAALTLVSTQLVSAQGEPRPNQFWWPDQLDRSPLRQHAAESNPLGAQFDYAKAFASLDLNERWGHPGSSDGRMGAVGHPLWLGPMIIHQRRWRALNARLVAHADLQA
jgi:hypothetical protein